MFSSHRAETRTSVERAWLPQLAEDPCEAALLELVCRNSPLGGGGDGRHVQGGGWRSSVMAGEGVPHGFLHANPLAARLKKNGTKEPEREVPSSGHGSVTLEPSIDRDTAPSEKGEVVPTSSSRFAKYACYPLKALLTKLALG